MNSNTENNKKLSFSIGKTSNKKILKRSIGSIEKEEEKDRKVLITSLDDVQQPEDAKKLIIPFKGKSIITNTAYNSNTSIDTSKVVEKKEIGYGLVVMKKKTTSTLCTSNNTPPPALSQVEAKAEYEEDIKTRPDELSTESETYKKIPVDEFGAALLRGMGWKDGQGVGRNKDKVVKIEDLQLRPKNLGLGADIPDIPEMLKKLNNTKK